MNNKIYFLLENINNTTQVIFNNCDNKTKYNLISSLQFFNSKLEGIYLSILNKELCESYNIFTVNILVIIIIKLLIIKIYQ